MTFRNCVAVDLGASSGRVMLARYERECRSLTLREIHRFKNGLHSQNGYVTWDVDSLESAIRLGLNMVCEEGIRIDSIGIDTWGVDFVLLDQQGQRVGLPVAYRDSRTNGLMAQAQQQLGKRDIYQRSGIQFLPFNTLYQLRALTEQQPELIPHIAHALLMPDYFSYRLTGKMNWEYTNATTTQLVNINSDDWDESLLAWSGANKAWFGRPTHPGNVIGHWICPQGNEIPVVAVASHDTASAVIASPLNGSRAAYLSSGTWSLMGFESQTPFTNDTALAANITNEGGAEGRYRVLKILWAYGCFSECFRSGKSTISRRLSPRHRHFRPAASSSIPMTIALLILTRCAAKFRLRVGKRRNRSREVMLNWRAVFSTVWRCCMPMCCMSWRSCVVKISRNCILSAVAARTRCSTSYVPMPAVFG